MPVSEEFRKRYARAIDRFGEMSDPELARLLGAVNLAGDFETLECEEYLAHRNIFEMHLEDARAECERLKAELAVEREKSQPAAQPAAVLGWAVFHKDGKLYDTWGRLGERYATETAAKIGGKVCPLFAHPPAMTDIEVMRRAEAIHKQRNNAEWARGCDLVADILETSAARENKAKAT